MSQKFNELNKHHIDFIEKQKMFFVATALETGHVNLSPKGMDSFKVIDNKTVIWLNLTGSGNETSTHVQRNSRMTIMFCSFEGPPLIFRIYGNAVEIRPSDQNWQQYYSNFKYYIGARQIFLVNIEFVASSCGYAVPQYSFIGNRTQLLDWADKRGADGVRQYWADKNITSLDGLPTNIQA